VTLYPLDAVRNAAIDRTLEPILEEIRTEVAASSHDVGTPDEVLEAFDYARPRLNVLASLLAGASGPGADISSGLAFLPILLRRRGHAIVATERDPTLARLAAAAGIEIREYDIGRTPPPFEPASQDYVVLSEVLEHLPFAPQGVLAEVGSLVRPGGRLLLTTPNIARAANMETLATGESFHEPVPDLPLGAPFPDRLEHIREYSIRETVDAVEGAGLGVRRVLMTGWGDRGYAPLPNPYANEIIVVEAER